MEVKDMSAITAKWIARAGAAREDYEKGVKSPRRPWAQAAAAAEPNYKDGVTKAAAAGRYGKGVQRAGDAKYTKGAVDKGVPRFPAGVSVAAPDYQQGFEPFRAALQGTTLSPRKARRDPSNLNRVAQVVAAMIKTAEAQGR